MTAATQPLRRALAVVALCAAVAPAASASRPAPPAPLDGFVTRVVDGDSLWVDVAGRAPLEVRLRDADAPEMCQEHGDAARRALAGLVLGRRVALRPVATDRHGRTIAAVAVDGVDVARQLVTDGHAWSTRTRWDRGPFVREERVAAALKRGLHARPAPEPPADFRRRHGPCAPARPTPPPPAAR